jgi:hypothetical protein
MNPTSFLKKLTALERSLTAAKGDFELFGVVLREESREKWDLVVAAPWLHADQLESYRVIADALRATFTLEEYLNFSRIVILEKSWPFLEDVLSMTSVEHGLYEIIDMTLSGISIRRAYIITAKRRPARKRRRKRDRSPAQ